MQDLRKLTEDKRHLREEMEDSDSVNFLALSQSLEVLDVFIRNGAYSNFL